MSFQKPALPIYVRGPFAIVPERSVDNQSVIDWMKVKIRPSWIEKRTGIKTRHWVKETESTSDLAFHACEKLFSHCPNLRMSVRNLQLTTISGDFLTPPTSPLLQYRLGLKDTGAVDLGAACAGYVTGLHYSASLAATTNELQLLVAADVRSKFIDPGDFATAVLFGDGASACLVSATEIEHDFIFLGSQLFSDGSVADLISIPSGGSKSPFSLATEINDTKLKMKQGAELFLRAAEGMANAATAFLAKMNCPIENVKWFVPHQANLLLVQETARRLNINLDNVVQTVVKYGNTSGSSTGLALADLLDCRSAQSGDLVLLIAAGGGGLASCCLLQKS
ncbi:MAG: ketoacyl-ACP synthase III [Bdellovibrionales bacterium]|nr:ketoacyl-ACP synthase III [Bdellovibrionales bacterium]